MVQKCTPSLCVDLDSLLFGRTGKLFTQVYACGVSSAKHRWVRLKSLAPMCTVHMRSIIIYKLCKWTPRQVRHNLILLCLSKLVNAPVVYVMSGVSNHGALTVQFHEMSLRAQERYLPQQLTTCEGHYVIGLIAMRDKVQSITVCWSGLLPLVWFNSMNQLIAYTCSMELWSTCCHDGYALRLWARYNGHKLTPPFYSSQIIT